MKFSTWILVLALTFDPREVHAFSSDPPLYIRHFDAGTDSCPYLDTCLEYEADLDETEAGSMMWCRRFQEFFICVIKFADECNLNRCLIQDQLHPSRKYCLSKCQRKRFCTPYSIDCRNVTTSTPTTSTTTVAATSTFLNNSTNDVTNVTMGNDVTNSATVSSETARYPSTSEINFNPYEMAQWNYAAKVTCSKWLLLATVANMFAATKFWM